MGAGAAAGAAGDVFALAALLEPCYDSGGDAYDYAVNAGRDPAVRPMGHGLAAAGVATFALSAYGNSRRRGESLAATYAEIDAAVFEP